MSPKDTLKKTQAYLENLEKSKKTIVKVGLPKEKIGGKVYGNDLTIIRLGAIHEYGGTWTHPGGTPYKIGKNGKAVFIKKGEEGAVGVTKPHSFTIPRRSFLNLPFIVKQKELKKELDKQFKLVLEDSKPVDSALGIVGVVATNIVKEAFTTQGYGKWKKSKKASGQTLIRTALLRNSNTWVITRAS